MRVVCLLLLLPIAVGNAWAHASYTGYSGAPGRENCASSCHGSDGGSIVIGGFPAHYIPNQTYEIVVQHRDGTNILNFNASCRIGTGTENAGTLAAGTFTETYDAEGERNGIHLAETDQNSATFNWTAPEQGTGDVHLYLAGHQGPFMGPNTDLVMLSTESSTLPAVATNPVPANNAVDIVINTNLLWTAGAGAITHDVYFGTTNPPDSVTNLTVTHFDPPGDLVPGTTYYWRIDERSAGGVATGNPWQFTTLALPVAASNPTPANDASEVASDATLSWTIGARTATQEVFFGTANPPPMVVGGQSGNTYIPPQSLLENTDYYWQINSVNSSGTTTGSIWHFRSAASNTAGDHAAILPSSLTLGPVYPNPFNATVNIAFTLARASNVRLAIYDLNGRLVALLTNEQMSEGDHRLRWSSDGMGSGIYLLRLTTGRQSLTTKIVALK